MLLTGVSGCIFKSWLPARRERDQGGRGSCRRSDQTIKPSAARRRRAACRLFDECLMASAEISDVSGADEAKSGSLAGDGGENCGREGEDGRMEAVEAAKVGLQQEGGGSCLF